MCLDGDKNNEAVTEQTVGTWLEVPFVTSQMTDIQVF